MYPVDKTMLLFQEEQFGPVIPIAVFDKEGTYPVADHCGLDYI